MIKAIFFDIGNVLITDGYTLGIKKYEKINSIPDGLLYKAMHDYPFWKEFSLGLITEDKYFDLVKNNFNSELNIDILRKTIMDEFAPNHKLADYARTLKSSFTTGIISNNTKEWFEYLMEKYGWNDIFKIKAVSGYVHFRKPDKRIFQYALDQADIKGEEAIYIDDRDDRIGGAIELGFNIIIYKNLKQLKLELKKYV